jgi:hypothetical protein
MTGIQEKTVIHKVCNLIIEIQGTMYDENETIWKDLMTLLFTFVNSANNLQVDAALQIFNGLFSYIMDYLVQFKNDLIQIFAKTL